MKRVLLFLVGAVLLVGGLLFEWLGSSGPEAPSPDAAISEQKEARGAEQVLVTSGGNAIAERRTVEFEPHRLVADADHISGIVVDTLDRPVEGASCRVMHAGSPVGLGGDITRATTTPEVIASTKADARGAFRIRVPSGYWLLRVEAESMSPWEERFLRPGDFRWIRLRPARSIVIRVRDESAAPVAGATVRLLHGEFHDPGEVLATWATDGNGDARLDRIPSGTWYVHVAHPDFVSVVQRLPPAHAEPQTVEVRLEHGVRIVGTVTVRGHAPPQAARVLFETLDGAKSSHAVEADAGGRYESRVRFPAGVTLEVAALLTGFGEARREVSLEGASREHDVSFDLDSWERFAIGKVVDSKGRALEGIDVHVKPLLALPPEGVIRIDAREIVTKGLPDFQAHDPKPSIAARFRRAAATDSQGRFRIEGLNARKPYQILLVSDEHSNAVLWLEEGEPGSTRDYGKIELASSGRVWGNVRRHDGSPIEGAVVHTITWDRIDFTGLSEVPMRRPTTLRSSHESITNADGYFSIQPYPRGEVHLSCLGTIFGPYTLTGESLGPLELVTEDVHRMDPARRIHVALQVVDETGAPVSKSYAQSRRVRSPQESPGQFAFDDWMHWSWDIGDAAGRLELEVSEEGTFEIEVRDLEGQLATQSFEVALTRDGLRRDVILSPSPEPSAPLSGVVQTVAGTPLADVRVELVPDTGRISCDCLNMEVRTDASGAFSFGRFMKGNHRLIVKDPQERVATAYFAPAVPGDSIVITMESLDR